MPSDYDLNRFKKTYPFVRREPVIRSLDITEAAVLEFNGVTQVLHTFIGDYLTVPTVVATADDDINVWVSAVSRSACTVSTSAVFTGNVYIQITEVD